MSIAPTPPRNPPSHISNVTPSNSPAFQRVYDKSRLEDPFGGVEQAGLNDRQYHTSQRATMNFQLRDTAEKGIDEWIEELSRIQRHTLEVSKTLQTNDTTLRIGLDAYAEGYHTADAEEVPLSQIMTKFGLTTTKVMCDELVALPTFDSGTARVTFNELLASTTGLSSQRLAQKRKHLHPLDAFSGKNISATTAALHERLHMDVMRPVVEELQKNEVDMARLERNAIMLGESRAKAKAERRLDQAAALQEQEIAIRSELCMLAISRMQMLDEYSVEVTAHTDAVKNLTTESKKKGTAFKEKADDLLHHINLDLKTISDMQEEMLNYHTQTGDKYHADQKLRLSELERATKDESNAWEELKAVLTKLSFASKERRDIATSFMNAKEKEDLRQQQYLLETKTINKHVRQLNDCETVVSAGASAAAEFATFVEEMDARLSSRDVNGELLKLQLDEGRTMLGAFVSFEDVSETLQATKRIRLDLLHQEKRQRELDLEQALAAFDPNAAQYKEGIETSDRKIMAIEGYLNHLGQVVGECEREAAPFMQLLESHGVTLEDDDAVNVDDSENEGERGSEDAAARALKEPNQSHSCQGCSE